MRDSFNDYRTLLLSMNLGGGLTDKQKDWIYNWVKQRATHPAEVDKAATIAYQYDIPDDLVNRIRHITVE